MLIRTHGKILRLDRKFTILFIILFFALIFVNQNALEFLLKVSRSNKVDFDIF